MTPETDADSRKRFIILAALPLLLLCRFVAQGIVSRTLKAPSNKPDFAAPFSIPPKLTAKIAAQKREFAAREAAREKVAWFGNAGRWKEAVGAADASLRISDDPPLRLLRAEAQYRLGDLTAGRAIAKLLRGSSQPNVHNYYQDDINTALIAGDHAAIIKSSDAELARIPESPMPSDRDTYNHIKSIQYGNGIAYSLVSTPRPAGDPSVAKAIRILEHYAAEQRTYIKQHPALQSGDALWGDDDLEWSLQDLAHLYIRSDGRERDVESVFAEMRRVDLRLIQACRARIEDAIARGESRPGGVGVCTSVEDEPVECAFRALLYKKTGDKKRKVVYQAKLETYLNQSFGRDGGEPHYQLLALWREIAQ